jgi:AbrB family looped-hinge helix DNA binding protein
MKTKIDAKGRISIPQSVQDNLKLAPGDSISIELVDSGILITPADRDLKKLTDSVIVQSGKPKDKPRYFIVK